MYIITAYRKFALETEDYDATKDIWYTEVVSVLGEITAAKTRMEKKGAPKIKSCLEGEGNSAEFSLGKAREQLFISLETMGTGSFSRVI